MAYSENNFLENDILAFRFYFFYKGFFLISLYKPFFILNAVFREAPLHWFAVKHTFSLVLKAAIPLISL